MSKHYSYNISANIRCQPVIGAGIGSCSSVDILQYWPNIGLPTPDKCIQFFLNLNGTLNFQKDKIDYY